MEERFGTVLEELNRNYRNFKMIYISDPGFPTKIQKPETEHIVQNGTKFNRISEKLEGQIRAAGRPYATRSHLSRYVVVSLSRTHHLIREREREVKHFRNPKGRHQTKGSS